MDTARVFTNEGALRDWLADNLNVIESGLQLIGKEHVLLSNRGAGGRVDILARDATGLYVAIEIKRAKKQSRELVHEMSKYVVRLRDQEHLAAAEIRCIAVSTDWTELLEAYSFFANRGDVDAIGFKVSPGAFGDPMLSQVELLPLEDLPKFSPEFFVYYYTNQAELSAHLKHVEKKMALIPFARVAMVQCMANEPEPIECISFFCVWRIDEEHFEEIERTCGFEIGHLEPYGFPGWEAECDVSYWAADLDCDIVINMDATADDMRGTAEKVDNLLKRYQVSGVTRFGNWEGATLNDDCRIVDLLRAHRGQLPTARTNRYTYEATVDPRRSLSWSTEIDALLDFIGYERLWRDEIVKYSARLKSRADCTSVSLKALDIRNFFYRLHQAVEFSEVEASWFAIRAFDSQNEPISMLVGFWRWDAITCPIDAVSAIESVYGSVALAALSAFSAVDQARHDDAYRLHGFEPVVTEYQWSNGSPEQSSSTTENGDDRVIAYENPLAMFVAANPRYANAISSAMCSIGHLPRNPGSNT